jgi:hypothetical protein
MAHLGHSFGMHRAVRGSAPDTPQGAEPPAPPLRMSHEPKRPVLVSPKHVSGETVAGEVLGLRKCLSVRRTNDGSAHRCDC